MIEFFTVYFLMLLFGAIIITGWFLISRGDIIIQPDGKKKRSGLLFKSWQLFWEQPKGTITTQYKGGQLYKLKRELIQTAKNEGYTGTFMFFDDFILTTQDIKPFISALEHQIRDLKIEILDNGKEKSNDKSVGLTLYKKERGYRFPEWLRDVMAGCITCHASIYGTVIFWGVVFVFGTEMFSSFKHQTVGIILTWFSYCFSLAFLNTFFYKQLNKH